MIGEIGGKFKERLKIKFVSKNLSYLEMEIFLKSNYFAENQTKQKVTLLEECSM